MDEVIFFDDMPLYHGGYVERIGRNPLMGFKILLLNIFGITVNSPDRIAAEGIIIAPVNRITAVMHSNA